MKKTIFNTCVEVTSQEQANRLKQVCIDNGLKTWIDKIAFRFDGIEFDPIFEYEIPYGFAVYNNRGNITKKLINESEWLELLNQCKTEENIVDQDIATIEVLHDTLLDNHKYDLDSKLLTNARNLAHKLRKLCK